MIYTLQHCANNFENVDQIGDFLGKHAMRLTPVYIDSKRLVTLKDMRQP